MWATLGGVQCLLVLDPRLVQHHPQDSVHVKERSQSKSYYNEQHPQNDVADRMPNVELAIQLAYRPTRSIEQFCLIQDCSI